MNLLSIIQDLIQYSKDLEAWVKEDSIKRIKEAHKKHIKQVFYLPDNSWGYFN